MPTQAGGLKHNVVSSSNNNNNRNTKETLGKNLSLFLESSQSNLLPFEDDMKSTITFSADDKEQKEFKQLAQQMSERDMGLDLAALTRIRPTDETILYDLSDTEEGTNGRAKKEKKKKKKKKKGLNEFFQSSCPAILQETPFLVDDMKSVITFSAEDKEQKKFKQLAKELSTREIGLDIATLAAMKNYTGEEDYLEDADASETNKRENDLQKRLHEFARQNIPRNDNADTQSIVTFSKEESDQFQELTNELSKREIGLDTIAAFAPSIDEYLNSSDDDEEQTPKTTELNSFVVPQSSPQDDHDDDDTKSTGETETNQFMSLAKMHSSMNNNNMDLFLSCREETTKEKKRMGMKKAQSDRHVLNNRRKQPPSLDWKIPPVVGNSIADQESNNKETSDNNAFMELATMHSSMNNIDLSNVIQRKDNNNKRMCMKKKKKAQSDRHLVLSRSISDKDTHDEFMELAARHSSRNIDAFSTNNHEQTSFEKLTKEVYKSQIGMDLAATFAMKETDEVEPCLDDDDNNAQEEKTKGITNGSQQILTDFVASSYTSSSPTTGDDEDDTKSISDVDAEIDEFMKLASMHSSMNNIDWLSNVFKSKDKKIKRIKKAQSDRHIVSSSPTTGDDVDDTKSITEFSGVDTETDEFMKLASMHSSMNNIDLVSNVIKSKDKTKKRMKKTQSDRHIVRVQKDEDMKRPNCLDSTSFSSEEEDINNSYKVPDKDTEDKLMKLVELHSSMSQMDLVDVVKINQKKKKGMHILKKAQSDRHVLDANNRKGNKDFKVVSLSSPSYKHHNAGAVADSSIFGREKLESEHVDKETYTLMKVPGMRSGMDGKIDSLDTAVKSNEKKQRTRMKKAQSDRHVLDVNRDEQGNMKRLSLVKKHLSSKKDVNLSRIQNLTVGEEEMEDNRNAMESSSKTSQSDNEDCGGDGDSEKNNDEERKEVVVSWMLPSSLLKDDEEYKMLVQQVDELNQQMECRQQRKAKKMQKCQGRIEDAKQRSKKYQERYYTILVDKKNNAVADKRKKKIAEYEKQIENYKKSIEFSKDMLQKKEQPFQNLQQINNDLIASQQSTVINLNDMMEHLNDVDEKNCSLEELNDDLLQNKKNIEAEITKYSVEYEHIKSQRKTYQQCIVDIINEIKNNESGEDVQEISLKCQSIATECEKCKKLKFIEIQKKALMEKMNGTD